MEEILLNITFLWLLSLSFQCFLFAMETEEEKRTIQMKWSKLTNAQRMGCFVFYVLVGHVMDTIYWIVYVPFVWLLNINEFLETFYETIE
jgi:hypothetical protein